MRALVDYQDADYAALYLDRLQQVLAAERQADPAGAHGFAATREMARWLALWMAFDDIVRVAELKSRASRARARAQRGASAGDGDIVKVYDHFKPGAPEFAALLPASLAHRVTALGPAPQDAVGAAAQDRQPFGLRHGLAARAGLAALAAPARQPLRRGAGADRPLAAGRGARHARATGSLGHEIALCGRLIKGYGSTNERGKHNLLHVIDHLAAAPLPDGSPSARSAAIAAAREAALADEAGNALDAALVRHGAPPRPVQAQPVRWMKRRPAASP